MEYDELEFKIPQENEDYPECSEFVTSSIESIIQEAIENGRNKIIINTNLKLGLPMENINKIAGPFVEAWVLEKFHEVVDNQDNKYRLINVESQERLHRADVILQFRREGKIESGVTAEVDVKSTSEDIESSGKSPNITSFGRIRSAYIEDPDYIFVILSLKYRVYSTKNPTSGLMEGIMEIVAYNAYDLKYLSSKDFNYNPALGTGQIQVKDIHYISLERRTTWEFCQLLDRKYLGSTRKNAPRLAGSCNKVRLDKIRRVNWISLSTGVTKMSNLQIIEGDALEQLPRIPSESVDLIIADPPYNLGKEYGNNYDRKDFDEYLKFSTFWLTEARRILKPAGTIYVFMGFRFISYLYDILDRELQMYFNSWICWHYTQGMGKTKGFSPRHDDILMFTKGKTFKFNLDNIRVPQKYYRERNNMRGANPGDVWQFSHVHYCNENRQNHPTQKPEGLIERMVLASSDEGDTVLDLFSGSGTTLRVCQQLNRDCVGIELNPEYVKMIRERLNSEFTGFDSIDPRMERIPLDLNTKKVRQKYLENHKKWFLSHHDPLVDKFEESVQKLYGEEQAEIQEEFDFGNATTKLKNRTD